MSRKQRKDAQETRQRLLAAAVEVFARKGFWEATHAEICEKAQANIAAVNYHFGSKENLYVEAWKHAFEKSIQAHPPDGGVPPDAPPEERLRGHILALMHRTADPDNHEVEIMHRELANPTGLLNPILRETLEPRHQESLAIVRELLGDQVGEQQAHFCEMSIIGQCFGPMLHLRRVRMAGGGPHPGPPVHFDVAELADHVARFSLAGIRGIREEAQRIRKPGRRPARETRVSRHKQR